MTINNCGVHFHGLFAVTLETTNHTMENLPFNSSYIMLVMQAVPD